MKRAFCLLTLCLLLPCLLLGCGSPNRQPYLLDRPSISGEQPLDSGALPYPEADGVLLSGTPMGSFPAAIRRGEALYTLSDLIEGSSYLNFLFGDGSVPETDQSYASYEVYDNYRAAVQWLYGIDTGARADSFKTWEAHSTEMWVDPLGLVQIDVPSGSYLLYENSLVADLDRYLYGLEPAGGGSIGLDYDQACAYMQVFFSRILPSLSLSLADSDHDLNCRALRWENGAPLSDEAYRARWAEKGSYELTFYHLYEGLPVLSPRWASAMEGAYALMTDAGVALAVVGWHELSPAGGSIDPMPLLDALQLSAAEHEGEDGSPVLLDATLCYFSGVAPDGVDRDLFRLQWRITTSEFTDYVDCASGEVYCERAPEGLLPAAQEEPAAEPDAAEDGLMDAAEKVG